jgi:prephenate dehydrogenase
MVQYDAPEVFDAIEKTNPYAEGVRRQFFDLAASLNADLEAASTTTSHNDTGL